MNLSKSNAVESFLVHRLVLTAFVGPCPEGMEGCHEDGDPSNNRATNLRWDTHKNNQLDMHKHGTCNFKKGRASRYAKPVLWDNAKEIRRLYQTGMYSMRTLGIRYGVNAQSICNVIHDDMYIEECV